MRIDELFDAPTALKPISPEVAGSRLGLYDVVAAYMMKIGDLDYIFYFDNCAGKPDEPSFGFGTITREMIGTREKLGVSHSMTEVKNPFRVISTALKVLDTYIREVQPLTVTFSGAYNRQQEFWTVMAKKLAAKAPEGYTVLKREYSRRLAITRNPDIIGMPSSVVFEDAASDKANLKAAEEIALKFGNWFKDINEDVPLGKVEGFYTRQIGSLTAMYANGSHFGCESDLNIGFCWETDGSRGKEGASMFNGRDGKGPAYFVLLSLHEDARDKTDVMWGVRWEYLIHELTHYLDRKRQSKPDPRNRTNGLIKGANAADGAESYYNHPLEFNAYFQQGLHKLMPEVKRGRLSVDQPFAEFFKQARMEFQDEFRNSLTPEYQKKFQRRLYKLYMDFRAQSSVS